MNVLSMHSAGHDTGVSYFQEGRLVFSIESERLTRCKHDHRSEAALHHCLSHFADEGRGTDLIVTSTPVRNSILKIPDIDDAMGAIESGQLHYETTSHLFGKPIDCVVVLHEASHAALAAHYAGYRTGCLILVNEGKGLISRSSLYSLEDRRLQLIELDPLPWYATGFGWTAIGYLYGFGLGPQVAGRLMGIAGYGTATPHVRDVLLGIDDGVMRDRAMAEQVAAQLQTDERFGGDFRTKADVVATLQEVFTQRVVDLVDTHVSRISSPAVALGGGCALNLKTNSALRERLSSDVYIPPACGDAGQSLGAGIYAHKFLLGEEVQPFSVFSNGDAERKDILPALIRSRGLAPLAYDPDRVARELTHGAIVAFFGGRSEIGPRALGARSILANPLIPGMRKRLSEKLKGREWFRPLGAAMRLERFQELFPSQAPSPHMLFAYSVAPNVIPEATHVDGSSRIQTVAASDCRPLYDLLVEFEKQSGASALINTSLNGPGRAIAYRVTDVLDDFLGADVNLFVFEDLMAFNHPAAH
jgi:carbamoyltransferase